MKQKPIIYYNAMFSRLPYNLLEKLKTKIAFSFVSIAVMPVNSGGTVSNGPVSYIIGGIIALLILGYLIYTLLRPDKF